MGSSSMIDADAGWTPLYLSTIAGMSTCLGAAVVFCHPKTDDGTKHGRRNVSPGTMCFSLALAGSVMVTVSVVSIGPECLANPDTGGSGGGRWMSLWSWTFLLRALSFGLGWLLYFLLSKCAFPEPEAIIEASLLSSDGATAETATESVPLKNKGECVVGVAAEAATEGADEEDGVEGQQGQGGLPSTRRRSLESPSPAEERPTTPGRTAERGRSSGGVSRRVKRSDSSDSVRSGASSSEAAALPQDIGAEIPLLEAEDGKKKKKDSAGSKAMLTTMERLASFASGDDLGTRDQRRAWRVSMLLFVSLLCHNFPEGLAVCASALESDRLGLTVTVGIMIHNIPEGIAIAIPCLAARPDHPCLSFLLASFSGLAEPFGALVALIVLRKLPVGGEGDDGTDLDAAAVLSLENVLSFVAGIMIAVSICELFPEARRHIPGAGKMYFNTGTLCGIIIMVATELFLPS